jgi:hypothetical protein
MIVKFSIQELKNFPKPAFWFSENMMLSIASVYTPETYDKPDSIEQIIQARDYEDTPEHLRADLAKWKRKHPDDNALIDYIFGYVYRTYFETRLSKYFRYINSIVDYIKENFNSDSELDELQRKKYSKILQIHLSSFELSSLLYNCLSEYSVSKSSGEKELTKFVAKYKLVENVDLHLLLNRRHLFKLLSYK